MPRTRLPALLAPALAALLGVATLAATPSAGSAPVPTGSQALRPCADVEAIWVRGSGQSLSDAQADRFFGQLGDRVKAPTTFTTYELGSDPTVAEPYPAVAVGIFHVPTTVGASVSGGESFNYGRSVDKGVAELFDYLGARTRACPETQFVTGGFSQGAQVIGETYQHLGTTVRDRVVFNALFGDPKLYLPEGEGFWPPACRGADHNSAWRRTVPNCDVDNGSLGARKPYLPAGATTSTGLWCANHDFVCGSSKAAWDTSGHNYAQPGGDIDDAAKEIAGLLKMRMPDRAADFDTDFHVFNAGTTGLDVVFVIDSTGSMSGRIAAAKSFASTMAGTIAALRGRVALVEYRDAGDAFVARTLSGLQANPDDFRAKLGSITADGGGDTPEATLAALMQAMNSVSWRPGATKAAVVLTDAGFHDPDRATGDTVASVAARALEIDPVNVYPVVPQYEAADYQELAEKTSGKVIVDSGDTEAALQAALTKISHRPVAFLAQDAYYAQPGDTVTFDASRSYATEGSIASYMWDFDGDSVFDLTTTEPSAQHVYAAPFDGQVQVRVTDTEGNIGSASVPVRISAGPPVFAEDAGLPAAPTGVQVVEQGFGMNTRNVRLSWNAGADPQRAEWSIAIDGIEVGRMVDDARAVDITDIPLDAGGRFTVAGVSPDGRLGPAGAATLAASALGGFGGLPGSGSDGPGGPPAAGGVGTPTWNTSAGSVALTPRIQLRWTAGSAAAGRPVAARTGTTYDVRWRHATRTAKYGGWTFAALNTTASRIRSPKLPAGSTACFQVRARNTLGVTSAWSRQLCVATPVDDAALRASRGWKRLKKVSNAYAHTLTRTRHVGARLTLKHASAGRIGVVLRTGPRAGKVAVYRGRTLVRVVDLRGGAGRTRVVLLPSTQAGAVRLVARGGHRTIMIDGLAILRR